MTPDALGTVDDMYDTLVLRHTLRRLPRQVDGSVLTVTQDGIVVDS